MGTIPHKTSVPWWVRRLRIAAILKSRPRLVLANKIVDLRAMPAPPRFSTLPKDVLRPQLRVPETCFPFSE